MPVDLTSLNASITALTAEVARTEGTEDSAGKLIAAQGAATAAAVQAALQAEGSANDAAIAGAVQAVNDVTARFAAADDKLGQAIAANPGT